MGIRITDAYKSKRCVKLYLVMLICGLISRGISARLQLNWACFFCGDEPIRDFKALTGDTAFQFLVVPSQTDVESLKVQLC